MKRILIALAMLCASPAYAAAVTGTCTETSDSAAIAPELSESRGGVPYNITLSGTFVATVVPERSFDNGATWHPLTALGEAISFTAPVSETFEESEAGVSIRLSCTWTSGTVTYRLSY